MTSFLNYSHCYGAGKATVNLHMEKSLRWDKIIYFSVVVVGLVFVQMQNSIILHTEYWAG